MIAAIASLFRSLNAQLLYRQGLINVFFKAPYFLSVQFFKWWLKKRKAAQLTVIKNYDGDLKMEVDISKTMGASLFWTGFHEFNEMRFLNSFLKPDMVFVDVGANQGEFALFASKRLRKGLVMAFEPIPLFFERLVSNVQLNSLNNIKCFKVGLADCAAEVPIYYNASNSLNHEGLGSLYPIDVNDKETELITLLTLDEVVSKESVSRVDFIKVDVEGSEWSVLKGAQQVLQKFKPALMVELNTETSSKAGYNVDDMVSWLRRLDYTPYQIAKGRLEPLKMKPFCNAIFLAASNEKK